MSLEQRPAVEGDSPGDICGKNIPGKRNSKSKGPDVGVCPLFRELHGGHDLSGASCGGEVRVEAERW